MRSKKYKKIITISVLILILLLSTAYFIGLQNKNHSVKLEESSENPADKSIENNLISENDLLNSKNTQSETSQKNKEEQIEKGVENLISASLKVQDKTYSTKIKEGSSVYDLMNQLKNQGFSFSATKYSSLGFFVTEINGVKEDRKKSTYWTLYVNGKEAMVGASQLILKEGDLIEWKYENRNK